MVRRFLRVMVAAATLALGATGVARAVDADDDPRLDEPLTLDICIAIALDHNLELQAARLQYQSSRAGVGAAVGIYWPTFQVTGGGSNFNLGGEPFMVATIRPQFNEYRDRHDLDQWIRGGTASVLQQTPLGSIIGVNYILNHTKLEPDRHDTPNYAFNAIFTQPLLRGGGWRAGTAGLRSANIESEIAAADLRARELFVIEQAKTSYYETLRSLQLIEVNQQAVGRDSQLVRLSQSKLDTGLGTKRDVLSAEIQMEQDRGTLVDAQTSYAEAEDFLCRVLGISLGVHKLAFVPMPVTHDPIEIDGPKWLEKARRDNPVLKAATLTVERNRHLMQVAGNARLPQLDVSFGWEHLNDPDFNELRKEENAIRAARGDSTKDYRTTGAKGWTGGVLLSMPLGNKVLGNQYRQAELTYEQSRRLALEVERRTINEGRTAVRTLLNNVERLAILQKSIDGARSKLEFADVNFQLGRASNLDITDAQKDLVNAQTDYVNEVIDYKIQVARIEQLLGGF